jgi:hypothetical protein
MRFCRNAFVVWLTAFASKPVPTDLRSQKVADVARSNGFCVRQRLPVLPGSMDFAYAKGCRCCPDQLILRTPKAVGMARINCRSALAREWVLPQRICCLAHRVRQQAGSYRFAFAEGCGCCPDQWILRTQKVAGVARINGFCVRQRFAGIARINCRSALARECDFDAAYLSLSYRYLAIGSRPLALMAGAAADELRKSRNCLACSGCLLWVTTPAEYRVICCA